jgi:hypothetical protein
MQIYFLFSVSFVLEERLLLASQQINYRQIVGLLNLILPQYKLAQIGIYHYTYHEYVFREKRGFLYVNQHIL